MNSDIILLPQCVFPLLLVSPVWAWTVPAHAALPLLQENCLFLFLQMFCSRNSPSCLGDLLQGLTVLLHKVIFVLSLTYVFLIAI